jgi:Uma2 family endonuclease
MEIKVSEIFEKKDLIEICKELSDLITGKKIELYDFDDEIKEYFLIDTYDVISVNIWENENVAFQFGPSEFDICLIKEDDIIKIKD